MLKIGDSNPFRLQIKRNVCLCTPLNFASLTADSPEVLDSLNMVMSIGKFIFAMLAPIMLFYTRNSQNHHMS